MKIVKYYAIPFIIAITLIIYGSLVKVEEIVNSGISLIIFLFPAFIGSLIGIKKKKKLNFKHLYVFSLALTLFVAIKVVTNNYWLSSICLLAFGLYFLFLILYKKDS